MSEMHLICTDGDITPIWLLEFGSWASMMVGCTGLLGCIISLKDMTSHLSQSASPRSVLGGSSQLKHHQSDIPCQMNLFVLADGWAVTTDMVRDLMECSCDAKALEPTRYVESECRHLNGTCWTNSMSLL